MDVEMVKPVTDNIMIEKWLLVFLIVGGTSLVFLICFPIDFYLYRRRKKLARERVTTHEKKPIQMCRAGQYHAQVYPDAPVSGSLVGDDKASLSDDKIDKKQNKFVRIVNLFRKRKTEQRLMQLQMLTESKSESSSSEHPTVLINTNVHEDTSTSKTQDTDMGYSAEQSNVFTTKSISKTEEQYTEYTGVHDGGFSSHDKPTPDGIPYMARALSVMMRENEELFGAESKHLNYGSTEKINGVHMNRRIYESLNKSVMGERALIITTPGRRHSYLSETDDSARPSPTKTVLLGDSGDSSCDDSDGLPGRRHKKDTQRNIIKVRSSASQHSLKSKPPKGQPKRSKTAKGSNGTKLNRKSGPPPAPLPGGLVPFNLSDSDDDTDLDIAVSDTSATKQSDQHLNMDEIPTDGNASPIFRPIKTSFSEQYLSNGSPFGSKRNAIPSCGIIDEFADGVSSGNLSSFNYSLMDEGDISSSRQKARRKKTGEGDAHSLPNLTLTKAKVHNKMDYYRNRNRQGAASKDVSFSRY